MRINKFGFALILIAILAVTLVTCVDQTLPYSSEAELHSLTIGTETVIIAKSITSDQWESETYSLAGAARGSVAFNNEDAAQDLRVKYAVNPGARVEWGLGKLSVRPDEFFDPRVPIPFIADGDHIYIKVISDDNEHISYYRVFARYKSRVVNLNRIIIQTREGKTDETTSMGGNTPSNATTAGISVTVAESQGAFVEALPYDENATVKYAVIAGSTPPTLGDFKSPEEAVDMNDQDWLYVELTAENTIAKSYFKFKVDVGRIADIKTLTFKAGNSANQKFIVYGKGLPKEIYADVGSGDYSTADQPNDGFSFDIVPEDSEATISYAKPLNSATAEPTFTAFTPAVKLVFTNNDAFAIKVQSKNGGALFYKIKVTLVPANFKSHPKSAWYKKGVTAKPLTVELDRAGSFSYQWYESDSWYGIYGRHGTALDEKNNVSYVNGGPDMYYYLAQPDDLMPPGKTMRQPAGATEEIAWKITGATGASYIPPTNWEDVPIEIKTQGGTNNNYPYKPSVEYPTSSAYPDGPKPNYLNFTAGSTSESRYYWCVATAADGRTVASKRALILTETVNKMDHFIFELSDLPAKNIVPFAKKQEDPYRIQFPSNYFPAGFDPRKYEICIAIAQYYLPDGRPWTQNWTHGDLHFGYNNNSLTWWHNNLGANSGSIPLHAPHSSRGGLERKPDWVGFTPSGDPERGMPPTNAAGDLPSGYKPGGFEAGKAQGYFCGFIELLELRFSTAPPSN
jgi:hypothetical protein